MICHYGREFDHLLCVVTGSEQILCAPLYVQLHVYLFRSPHITEVRMEPAKTNYQFSYRNTGYGDLRI